MVKDRESYLLVKLAADDLFITMARKDHYVLEHRLMMAKHLGRCLEPSEVVHHKNRNRGDNRLINLELTIRPENSARQSKRYRDGYQKGYMDGQQTQISELKQQNEELLKQIRLLQWQLRELKEGRERLRNEP